MSDDTAKELAACLDYVQVVSRVLPIDEEADRMVAEAMRRNMPKASTKIPLKRRP